MVRTEGQRGVLVRVTVAKNQRLRAVGRPVLLLVEITGVPNNLRVEYLAAVLFHSGLSNMDYLVVDLGDLDGVRGWALAADRGERSRPAGGVSNVVDMVRAVEVLAIPATTRVRDEPPSRDV